MIAEHKEDQFGSLDLLAEQQNIGDLAKPDIEWLVFHTHCSITNTEIFRGKVTEKEFKRISIEIPKHPGTQNKEKYI